MGSISDALLLSFLLNDESIIFSRKYDYTELISGSQNYSSGYIIICKVNKVVISEVNLYFKNALTYNAAHQLLSKSQLQNINCWIPDPTGSESFAFQKVCITANMNSSVILTLNGASPEGLCIYPLTVPVTVGDHLRDQLIWPAE